MKIALCQMKVVAGRPDINVEKMCKMMREATANGARVVSFSEMCIPGYMIGDNWEDRAFIEDCDNWQQVVSSLAEELGITVLFGNVEKADNMGAKYEDGRPLKYNSVWIRSKTSCSTHRKVNLPNYREFDDKRYFAQGDKYQFPVSVESIGISASVCEDGWNDDYARNPIKEIKAYAENVNHLHFNLSCSPYTKGKNGARNKRFAKHSVGFSALCYVNCVGVQNNGKNVFVFDGSTTIYKNGSVFGALPPLVECIGYFDIDSSGNVTLDNNQSTQWSLDQKDPRTDEVLTYGIREYLAANGISRVVIGLSGGIDSALSALLHVRAIGSENVILVNMPSEHNSNITKSIAAKIASNLNCPYVVIPIDASVSSIQNEVLTGITINTTKHFQYNLSDLYYENVQARMRGAGIQAALASATSAVFPNNGNKAEMMVGYCTIAGDLLGYLAPLGDLWKHEVYDIARELSRRMGGILPDDIFTVKPSAELSDSQNVSNGGGDPIIYWYHDKLFASWEEPWDRKNIEDTLESYVKGTLLYELGLEDRKKDFDNLFPDDQAFVNDLERWWKQFKGIGVVKRIQAPPVLVIGRRAFGYDFRESTGTCTFTMKYLDMKKRIFIQ
jgi:NAD+ synthase (glutamine-hydrolysing)